MHARRLVSVALAALALAACDGGGLPQSIGPTPQGDGPRVRWDLNARPLPEIPLPNDVATRPDPTSPTGRRINASFIASTELESRVRAEFGDLDGWGTYAPITVAFDAPIDVNDLLARQGGERFASADFQQHAVYVVDLETGAPVPLDLNGGNFHYGIENVHGYYANDPRDGEEQIFFESIEEDVNGNGEMDPGEDTDFDGVLDHPNTLDGRRGADALATYDRGLWFYERQTNTLFLRPIVPMREGHEYAVVLTDRLRGETGSPVRSPFPAIHHVSQVDSVRRLPSLFAAHPDVYGDLADRGLDGVAFAWTFTTQTVTQDLVELREGLYGRGRYAFLADQFPPDLYAVPSRGGSSTFTCDPMTPNVTVVPWLALRDTLAQLAQNALGVDGPGLDELLATYDNVDHVVVAYYESPFLAGDPRHPRPDDHWQLGHLSASSPPHRDLVPAIIVVPREDATHHQPFPVTFYGHGYTGANIEALGFAGGVARNGVATVAIDAVGHGLVLDTTTRRLAEALFNASCLGPMGRFFSLHRAVDLDGDDVPDPGGDFWSAYIFHTRDVVRQSVLDHIQLIRILRSFGAVPGQPTRMATGHTFEIPGAAMRDATVVTTGDMNGDGTPDIAGDFDGNGVPDIGGWDNGYHAWGESLGAFIAPVLGGVEPMVRTIAPTSGAGGLIDVGNRSALGGVRHAVVLRAMGPLVISQPSGGPSQDSACAAGQRSIQFVVPSVNDERHIEIACLDASELAEGDAVVLQNASEHTVRCAGVGADGRFRVGIASDAGDALELDVYHGAAMQMDYATCQVVDDQRVPVRPQPMASRSISTWEVGHGTGEHSCARCAAYQTTTWERGEFLVAPTEGFGFMRQTPDFRRFQGLAQTALEPADPINYVGRFYLDPIVPSGDRYRDVTYTGPRSMLVALSVGDDEVPIAAGNAMARAAGLIPFVPPDGPAILADYRAPASFSTTHPGFVTPQQLLNDYHVLEGISRYAREPIPENMFFLADVDDLGDGTQLYTADGGFGGTLAPVRLSPPLRWTRSSVAAQDGMVPWDPARGTYTAISGVLEVYVDPRGNHGTEVPDPTKTWDEGLYFPQLLGRYFATDGRDLRYHTDPMGHRCLEDWTCDFSRP
jgi:hypothetical protein